jgi:geranylgeranyl diphosphate synthase type II
VNIAAVDMVQAVLEEYGAMAREVMTGYLPNGRPKRHLYDPVADYPSRGGKMMRPSLCIATAKAFGAEAEDAVRTAAGIEMLHNALLIHDDIEDESENRRGSPTLHELHGTPIALNAGDALAMLSLRPLLDNIRDVGPWLSLRIIEEMENMARESAEGQALELGWRQDAGQALTQDDYLVMVLKKTCWLAAIYPCRVGAMLGKRRDIAPEAFIRFGFFVGAAFQIHDDVLNLQATDAYGKEICGDLWEAKRTLMLIDLPQHLSEAENSRLNNFLRHTRETRSQADVDWLLGAMKRSGSIDRAQMIARGLAGAALPETRDKAFIRGLVTWVFQRDR